MGVSSISGNVSAATKPLSFHTDVSLNQIAKSTSAANVSATSQSAQSGVSVTGAKDVSPSNKPLAEISSVSNKKPVRTMSHMVQSYNAQGKIRIKYEDSNNNVIYQIPPEMVAKTQDLMTNSQSSANTKG